MDYSQISKELFVGRTPKAADYPLLHQLGVTLVINMRIGAPPRLDLNPDPIKSIWLPWIDSPLFPIPIGFLKYGARQALNTIDHGGAVYAHCAKGRHRGPAMGACILVAQGLTPQQAMQLIKEKRPASDPYIWYIRHRIEIFSTTFQRSNVQTLQR